MTMIRHAARAILGLVIIVVAWLTAATFVGGAVAAIDGNHGSIGYVIVAWWTGLVAAIVHILLRIVRLARRKG